MGMQTEKKRTWLHKTLHLIKSLSHTSAVALTNLFTDHGIPPKHETFHENPQTPKYIIIVEVTQLLDSKYDLSFPNPLFKWQDHFR